MRGIPFAAIAFLAALVLSTGVGALSLGLGYGFHRDEFYYLQCGEHLAAGYVDHPFGVPLIGALILTLAGPSLPVLILVASLAYAGTVAFSVLISRDLGGSLAAQRLTAIAIGLAPIYLASGGMFGTVIFDGFMSAAVAWSALRLARGAPNAGWQPGLLGAAAAMIKLQGFVFAIVILAAVAWYARRVDREVIVAAVISGLGLLPWLVWQSQAGWPGRTFAATFVRMATVRSFSLRCNF